MTRLAAWLLAALCAVAALPALAPDDDWSSDQPTAAGSPAPTALGRVYDMEFWAPNRGVLITADGLWAYDGTGWHQLSTVCGGTGGRVAWAGPLDFWTISDQPVGQSNVDRAQTLHRSLCHFSGGRVVASYAEPIGTAAEYEPMNAAACLSPSDCWFGGDRLPGTVNTGAFHLHWDGTSLTPYPSLTGHDASVPDPDRAVAGLVAHQGALYESVKVESNPVDGELPDHPYRLHEIFDGDPPAFVSLQTTGDVDYQGTQPTNLSPLLLSSDGDQLWAAGTNASTLPAPITMLRFDGGAFAPLTLNDAGGLLTPGTTVTAVAAEPGTDDAWIGYVPPADNTVQPVVARLARVHADGTVDSPTKLPGDGDALARKMQADRLACPAPGQCWLATRTGWLFHLGGDLPRDDEPAMHRLITFRPADAATIIVPPDTLPDDTSGLAPPVINEPPPISGPEETGPSRRARARKLVTGLRRRLVHRTTLVLTFTLTAKARVQLLAKRRSTVVARTRKATLAKGRHALRLRLNAKHWPTKLDLRATVYRAPSSKDDDNGAGHDPSVADDDPNAPAVTIEGVRSPSR